MFVEDDHEVETARSSPVLRRVVDASVEGPCVVLIWIRTDDVAEESQTPSRDRLGDRRLSGTDANLLVGGVSGEGNLQNVSKAPLIERIESLAGLHHHIPHYSEPYSSISPGHCVAIYVDTSVWLTTYID